MTFFPWDDINSLEKQAEEAQKQAKLGNFSRVVDTFIDTVDELFEMDYFYGVQDISMQLGKSLEPDFGDMERAINKEIDGKTYKDRIREYMESGTPADIARVIDTDAHRIYNEAMFTTASKNGATKKTWHTMADLRVRDSHQYLEGVTIPIDAEFYTANGNHTYFPSQFGVAEEDVNCRCWLTYSL